MSAGWGQSPWGIGDWGSLNTVIPGEGTVITPFVRALSLVGVAPSVVQSRVITPAQGQLTLVGGTAVINNPNWTPINDSQTPNWVAIAA
jgi:hypothetical protein